METKDNIFPVDISSEMKDSYLQYSMSVIVGRALPDARDGLKPVHRRVLFAMRDLNNTFDKPYKKSARVVGDMIGKYHPHGEAAVYDAIVRMAQDFSMNHILVDGQGNFGSIDGDTAAASRYTEIRMTQLAGELLKDLEKETVGFEWNYDDTLLMPKVLPAKFPNLLVNGSAGIAVGMASNIPPHNLEEVARACTRLLDEDLSLEELLKIIPGPDFPTAGAIAGQKGILQAYHSGRGVIVLRAKTQIEEKGSKEQIVITEIPYQVNKAHLIESIAHLVRDKKIEGISDIRDESSREGMRIVIVLKKRENSQVILNNLYKQTKLRSSFGIHLLALDRSGQPKTFSLKNILLAFLAHRRDVITRRLVFDLGKSQARMHILEGLIKALDHLDEVIAKIRQSKETASAKKTLMKVFDFSEKQAGAILDLRLNKLTGLERQKIQDEWTALKQTIEELKSILRDPKKIDAVIREELEDIRQKFSRPRKTVIEADEDNIFQDKDLIAKEDIVVLVTTSGGVKRILLEEYRLQRRGGVGLKGAALGPDEEGVWKTLCVNTHSTLVVLTNKGRLFHLEAFKIPAGSRTSKSRSIRNFLALEDGESVRAIVPSEDFLAEGRHLCMVSEKGVFKKTALKFFSKGRQKGVNALSVRQGDLLSSAVVSQSTDDILILTRKGMGIRFKENLVRMIKARSSSGVRGLQLNKEDRVIGLHAVPQNTSQYTLLTVSRKGYGKLTPLDTIRVIQRGGKGVKIHKLTDKTGDLAGALVIKPENQILIITNKGQNIRFSCQDVSQQSRHSQGVRLIRLKDGEFVTDINVIEEESGG